MDRRYLIASLFFIIAAVIAVVLVYPQYQGMALSAQTANEKQKEFDSQTALVQDISRLKSQYKEVKEEFVRVVSLLPVYNEGSTANLFVELEELAARNGMLLDTVSFSQSKVLGKEKEKRYQTVNAKLSLKGDYGSFKNFMRAVETHEHLMDITLISVSATKEKKEKDAIVAQSAISFIVDIDAYYQ